MAKQIRTAVAELTQLGPNLIKEVYTAEQVHELSIVEEHVRQCHEHFGVGGYYLTDIRKLKSAKKEAREYLRDHSQVVAVAILVQGGLSMLMGNLFIGFTKPPYLAKVFHKEELALAWLVKQGAELYP
ncbi:STAS/SEC14 domain-containing protein [Saprospira sp. CCB-QB6]|uniref:DUF7793 family protein n=1 Tax=Saprospira sp. CCB-QB6 TaxID=3023936 RepID=UPI0023497A73|nr:STAS/SEC14 domain-containing protein [Saprospira sp. CCB-QB6]WCL81957.1 STAS/SEC14 domain-containing protein [Saprospira sp. CCB-QB6]